MSVGSSRYLATDSPWPAMLLACIARDVSAETPAVIIGGAFHRVHPLGRRYGDRRTAGSPASVGMARIGRSCAVGVKQPPHRLAGYLGYHVEIAVDVKHLCSLQFGRRGDDQVRDRPSMTVAAMPGE